MFSGIIEAVGSVNDIKPQNGNLLINVQSKLAKELSLGDSLAHNGICLTIIEKLEDSHKVLASEETINKTNLKYLEKGHIVNLERALMPTSRLDGHIVQGHIDDTAICANIEQLEGSHIFTFRYNNKFSNLLIEKGSVALNGISLTIINLSNTTFSVSIIPYTFNNTNLHSLTINEQVNIEYDIIGKYVARLNK